MDTLELFGPVFDENSFRTPQCLCVCLQCNPKALQQQYRCTRSASFLWFPLRWYSLISSKTITIWPLIFSLMLICDLWATPPPSSTTHTTLISLSIWHLIPVPRTPPPPPCSEPVTDTEDSVTQPGRGWGGGGGVRWWRAYAWYHSIRLLQLNRIHWMCLMKVIKYMHQLKWTYRYAETS